ncbi:helix-turn-helix transcriptional regulator [Kribbella solani]|uniref:helix-turn-helix domain-containing protein n=1 Tax=Kribbella solani TaxID=236067 RepID=UPI0029A80F7E|nr:helix-turn-helix transcriptional regulator [Kribbella solani]MDX3006723.1 helix-turn-helix transcriptional regulator [Kribbella solani]
MTTSDEADRAYTEHLQADIEQHTAAIRESLEAHERVIGRKVRQLREDHGWSQTDLSERLARLGLDIHQTTVAKMESGRRPLRVSEAVAVATAFGLPAGALLWLPLTNEPASLSELREEMMDLESHLEATRKMMVDTLSTYAQSYAEFSASLHMKAKLLADASAAREKAQRDMALAKQEFEQAQARKHAADSQDED